MQTVSVLRYRTMLILVRLVRGLCSYAAANNLCAGFVHRVHPLFEIPRAAYMKGIQAVFDDTGKTEAAWSLHEKLVGVTQCQSSYYLYADPSWIGQCRLNVRGREHVDKAVAAGKGVLVMTYHHHFNMFFCSLLGTLGYPVTTIAMDPKESPMYEVFGGHARTMYANAEKHFSGGDFVMVKPQSQIRPIIRAFDNGHLVVTANDFPDPFSEKSRLSLPFLNTRLECPSGTVRLAVKRKAPVLAGYLTWEGDDRFTMHIETLSSGDDGLDTETVMRRYIAILETMVAESPGLWEGWKWIKTSL